MIYNFILIGKEMTEEDGIEKPPPPFGFPFKPYGIQLQLMEAIYESIEQRRVAILESPTGTGKSLSAICAALSWLQTDERRQREECQQRREELGRRIEEAANDADWMGAHKRKMEAEQEMEGVEEASERQKKIEERLEKARQRQKTHRERGGKRKKHWGETIERDDQEEEGEEQWKNMAQADEQQEDQDLIPSDAEDDAPIIEEWKRKEGREEKENVGMRRGEGEEPAPLLCRKLIYASRTHSQLEQFARELEKTEFRPRVLTLGSRQMLCVNEQVKALGSAGLVNDRCNELLDAKAGGGKKMARLEGDRGDERQQLTIGPKKRAATGKCGCEFARADAIEDLSDAILTANTQMDSAGREMREIVNLGQQRRACPYFASRSALGLCQLVLVPYNILLHKGTRQAWQLDIRDNVVIVDEAHNLLQTLAAIHGVELNGAQLALCTALIHDYVERFRERLSPRNLCHIRQFHAFTAALHHLVNLHGNDETVLTLTQFMAQLGSAADIDLFRLLAYLEQSKLCRKLRDFRLRPGDRRNNTAKENLQPKGAGSGAVNSLMERIKRQKSAREQAENGTNEEHQSRTPSSTPLYQLREFIEAITSRIEDARIVISRTDKSDVRLRFLLLNPAERLRELVSDARALILLGGTMRPVDQLMDAFQRVCGVSEQRISQFHCGHVIDDGQLIALQIGKGPDQCALNFQFANQSNPALLSSLARSMLNLLRHIPHGAVAFLPSHSFLANFVHHSRSSGQLAQLEKIKSVFVEAKSGTGVDEVWTKFCDSARTPQGAVLFAVVGGKLSEGINFSDDLGRCVLMIGLPYPNKNSVEMRERIWYLNQTVGPGAGQRFYEQQCLQAVNQSIGRAIRHRRDHAAIVLLDERYARDSVVEGMPEWIRRRLTRTQTFPEALQRLIAFFRAQRRDKE